MPAAPLKFFVLVLGVISAGLFAGVARAGDLSSLTSSAAAIAPVQEVTATVTEPVEQATSAVTAPVQQAVAPVQQTAASATAPVIETMQDVVATAAPAATQAVTTVTSAVADTTKALTPTVEAVVEETVSVLTSTAQGAVETLSSTVTAAATTVGAVLDSTAPSAVTGGMPVQLGDGAGTSSQSVAPSLRGPPSGSWPAPLPSAPVAEPDDLIPQAGSTSGGAAAAGETSAAQVLAARDFLGTRPFSSWLPRSPASDAQPAASSGAQPHRTPGAPPLPGAGLSFGASGGTAGGALLVIGILLVAFLLVIPNAVRWLRPAAALGLLPAYVAPGDRPG